MHSESGSSSSGYSSESYSLKPAKQEDGSYTVSGEKQERTNKEARKKEKKERV